MYANFYGNDDYHQARKNFVYKTSTENHTPENIAIHRQAQQIAHKLTAGSLHHFVWQDYYTLGDEKMDEEHKDLFVLANKLIDSGSKDELNDNIFVLYHHVKEHFAAEEALMKKAAFQGYKGHEREHRYMLEKLTAIDHKINDDDWQQADIEEFVDKWVKHIINADMMFDSYFKNAAVCAD